MDNRFEIGGDITVDPLRWYRPIFADCEFSIEKLPKIVPCGKTIEMGESGLAKEFGLDGLILVTIAPELNPEYLENFIKPDHLAF